MVMLAMLSYIEPIGRPSNPPTTLDATGPVAL